MIPLREPTPGEPGTYALLFRARAGRIEVGRLGEQVIEPGWYLYLGSAFGPGGVAARVGRHLREGHARGPGARPHWHVDRLHEIAEVHAVWFCHDRRRREHLWAREARRLDGASIPIDGFGSSDCDCRSHLIRYERRPSARALESRVMRRAPTHAPVCLWPCASPVGEPEVER